MTKPVLVVMAAGMGSRYGGLKQIDPVGNHNQVIMDYSIYDAVRAGFETVVFVIKHEIEASFKEGIGSRLEKVCNVKYAYQEVSDLPEGYAVPEGRVKPWGTCHAILAARKIVEGPFAVINADDYYGPEAFKLVYDYLSAHTDSEKCYEFAMVGYHLGNTVTEHGHVARGICQEDNGYLSDVVERTHIEKRGEDAAFTEDGVNFEPLSGNVKVSMNCWGFGKGMFKQLTERFPGWLDENLSKNPEKAEYFLPFVVNAFIKDGTGSVAVLPSRDKWYGMTYKEDMPGVIAAIQQMRDDGIYPVTMLD